MESNEGPRHRLSPTATGNSMHKLRERIGKIAKIPLLNSSERFEYFTRYII